MIRHLALLVALASPLTAAAAPPTVARVSPRGAERGKPVEVVIAGTNLTPQTRLVLPFKAEQTMVPDAKSNPAQARIRLTVDAAVPVGIYPARVATEDGLAPLFLFCIDHFPAINEVEDNSSFDKAQKVDVPVVVNGECAGGDIDCFRFNAKQGQRLVVETEAARLGSGIVPQLRLTDSKNRFLAADDSQSLRGDCRIVFTAPADGDYVVEISDTRYRGAAPPFYRLKIADYDIVEEIFPLGGRRGDTVAFTLRGGSLANPVEVRRPLDDAQTTGTAFLALDGVGKPGALPALLAVGDLPERAWTKTDGKDPKALDILPPLTINGRLEAKGDIDRFQFPVAAGQRYRLRVQAESLGSNLDGVLRVSDQAGKQLALVDDVDVPAVVPGQPPTKAADPVVDLTVPAGVTLLKVELFDQRHRGGLNFVYRLSVEAVVPDFELRLPATEVNVPRGGSSILFIPVIRQGFTGSIQLAIPDLPPGVTATGGDVPANGTSGILTLSAAAGATLAAPVLLRVEGKATSDGKELRRVAEQKLVLGKEVNPSTSVLSLPNFALALTGAEPFAVQGPAMLDVVRGYATPLPITLTRTPEAMALPIEVTASLPQLTPPGQPLPATIFALTPGSAAANILTITLTLTPGPQVPEGKTALVVQGKTKIANVDRLAVGPLVAINVLRPYRIEIQAGDVILTPGQTITLKGKIVRQAVFKEAVALKLDGLPAGVTLAAPLAPIAPTAADFQIELKVDPKYAVPMANLSLGSTTTIGGVAHPQPPVVIAAKLK